MFFMNYDKSKLSHQFLFALVEMRDVEDLLFKATAAVSERTDVPQAKQTFRIWSEESRKHAQTLQKMIEKVKGNVLTENCLKCIEDGMTVSYAAYQIQKYENEVEVRESLGMVAARDLAEKHITIESEVEGRYAQIAEMTDEEEIKKELIRLSDEEKNHHVLAQKLIDLIDRAIEEDAKARELVKQTEGLKKPFHDRS